MAGNTAPYSAGEAACDRIAAALSRMDAALDRIDDAGGLADLARRHEQLRAEVRAVVAELDGLIGDR